jgi:hypothetical protein
MIEKKDSSLTESEKIDAIYRMLTKQQKREKYRYIFSWITRIVIIISLFQVYIDIITNTSGWWIGWQIRSFITEQVGSIAWSIVKDIAKDNPGLMPNALPRDGSPRLNTIDFTAPTTPPSTPNTHINQPKTRNYNELLKDQNLVNTATDIMNKNKSN